MAEKQEVGRVFNYFSKISVAAIELSAPLKKGDRIFVEASEPFEQEVGSMQIEHDSVEEVGAGQSVGMKVSGECREGDRVYKIVEAA